jgi:glycosyltransferase involved in cell wall biosynthesis
MHASWLFAEAGWEVTLLSAPKVGSTLEMSPRQGVREVRISPRPTFVMGKQDYLAYCGKAYSLARELRPRIVYASDPIGAFPGVVAAAACGAHLIYHEHDSPTTEGDLNPMFRWARRRAMTHAWRVVLPNRHRADAARQQIPVANTALRVVWNVPRTGELPVLTDHAEAPLQIYYHGSITSSRLPETVAEAISRFGGKVRLTIAGYEAPDARGYCSYLMDRWNRPGCEVLRYVGEVPSRIQLLKAAAEFHVGLAIMPMATEDINMQHMAGASNKAFDYMAAGMALIVSELPEWRQLFVDNEFGKACDPRSVDSVELALRWYLENPSKRREMAQAGRRKIETEWNYETAFAPILSDCTALLAPSTNRICRG